MSDAELGEQGEVLGWKYLMPEIAVRNLELFESEGVLENVLALEPHLEARMQELTELPMTYLSIIVYARD